MFKAKMVEMANGNYSIQAPDGTEFAIVFDLGMGFPVAKEFAAKAVEAPAMYEALGRLIQTTDVDEIMMIRQEVSAILGRIDK